MFRSRKFNRPIQIEKVKEEPEKGTISYKKFIFRLERRNS